MKNLILSFLMLTALVSCGIIHTANKANPTVIISGSSAEINANGYTYSKGQNEVVHYDTGTFNIKISNSSVDTTFNLDLSKDSTVVLEIGTTVKKTSYNRY